MLNMTNPLTAEDVYTAAERIRGIVRRTPLIHSEYLSERYGCHISLKLENMQKTGAFKLRGAYNKIASLSDFERQRGLIAASSGNHAQGVGYAARAFGIEFKTRIYMPESTPQTKIDSTSRYGVEIILIDGTYDDASDAAHEDADASGATYIHPYNDWDIIAGQGTIGLEIMQDAPDTEVIVAPVGGGGLLSGISLAAKSIYSDVRLYGVQCTYERPSGATIADGIRVKRPGDNPSILLNQYLNDMVQVPEAAIAEGVKTLLREAKIQVEGSGAVGIVALEENILTFSPDDHVVVVLSGGNIDLKRLHSIIA